jgi:uncharacterized protein
MSKSIHEFRDPVHIFIRLFNSEREVVDSRAFQRLRFIHQLSLTHFIYPGANHNRFEHSLGVMELASRIYDVIIGNLGSGVKDRFLEFSDHFDTQYWKRVLRVAALCHDIGHMPFSHGAEKALLPENWTHEALTVVGIMSEDLRGVWSHLKLDPKDIVKLALGPKEYHQILKIPEFEKYAFDKSLTPLESILAEIITGNAFGADRMDYLLRDSYHAGVAYGRFDHYRLIDTLRILPRPRSGSPGESTESDDFCLGIEEGGLQSAEALLLARYQMFSQVYLHKTRRIYDIHLKDFMANILPGGKYPIELEEHLKWTDSEVLVKMREAALDVHHPGHLSAKCIIQRKHYKRIYESNPDDRKVNLEAGRAILTALSSEFGNEQFKHDDYSMNGGSPDFPVLLENSDICSAFSISTVLPTVPGIGLDHVYGSREVEQKAKSWLARNRQDALNYGRESEEA